MSHSPGDKPQGLQPDDDSNHKPQKKIIARGERGSSHEVAVLNGDTVEFVPKDSVQD